RLPSAVRALLVTASACGRERVGTGGMAHSFSRPSPPPVSNCVLCGWKETAFTGPPGATYCATGLPAGEAACHTTRRLSAVPPATRAPLGARATALTAALGPMSWRTCWPLAKVETRTVLSALADRTVLPSADSDRAVTASVCGGRARGAVT